MMILDASVLIAHLESTDVHHGRARALLTAHRHRTFAASTVTLAEFLVLPTRRRTLAAARQALDALDVLPQGLADDACWRLAELRAETGLRLPDCCVLYTAQQQADCLIATFDDKLQQQARLLDIPVAT